MRIKSKYNRYILKLIAYFRILPTSNFDMLLKACPILENENKFKTACRNLRTRDKLIFKSAVFVCDKNNRDCLELTKLGKQVVEENEIYNIDKSSMQSLRDNSIESRKMQFKISEAYLFFLASNQIVREGKYLLRYYNRDILIDFLKYQNKWSEFKQAKSSRTVGVLELNHELLSVYDLKDANIELHINSEKTFMDLISVATGKPIKMKYDKILITDTVNFVDKTIKSIFDSKTKTKNLSFNNNLQRNVEHIFKRKVSMKDEKLYLLINCVDQLEIVEYFKYENVENEIDKFVFEIKRCEVLKDKNLRANNPNIGRSFGSLAAYETDDEVVFHMVQQELNKLNTIFTFLCDILEGRRKETRRLVMYGLECNKPLFEKIFEGFDIEYRVINGESLMKEIKRRKGD